MPHNGKTPSALKQKRKILNSFYVSRLYVKTIKNTNYSISSERHCPIFDAIFAHPYRLSYQIIEFVLQDEIKLEIFLVRILPVRDNQ